MESSYIDSLEEPWKALAVNAAPSSTGQDSLPTAAARLDQLELAVRSMFVQLFFETQSEHLVDVVGDFWRRSLDLCRHLVHEASKDVPSPSYENMTPRRLPILLLEDSLDALSVEDSKKFWSLYVEPTLDGPDLLLGDLMWKSSSSCSLPFLRVCNQFLRVLDTASQSDQCEWRGRIMIALAKGFSVADRSALKLWGTFHSTNINDFESADKYHENHPEVEQSNTGGSNKMNYKLYESFWSLQADFANPNQIQVGAFMKKLKTVFDALESAASIRTDWSATPTCNSVKYLTASSLLPTQLASPEFRSAVVSQFLILSLHLSSESPVLANALTPLLTRAKKLLQSDNPECYHLLCDSVLSHRENAWRRWKKDKCPTAAFAPKQKPKVVAASPKTKGNPMMNGALGDSEAAAENEYESFRSEELLKGSQELKKALPTLEEYLEPYVEALDPESGIEAEYHPGNDPLYAWRAMRLYARHQLPLLKHCRKPTDLERITRIWYSSQGKEIPGDMMSPLPNDEEEESCASKLEEEEADAGDQQDHEEELKTQENDEADEADDRSPIHDENMIDDECDEEAPQTKDEFESPDNNDIANDEPEEAGRQSDSSTKNDITSDAGSFSDNAGTDVMEGESPLESKLVGAADDVEGKTEEESILMIESEHLGASLPITKSEVSTEVVLAKNNEDVKNSGKQSRNRRERERDRRRKRSPSLGRERGGKAPRGDRRGGGRGGRREDGLPDGRDRGRREDSPNQRGGRREDNAPPRGRGPPPSRPDPGPPVATPPFNRGGGRYDDRSSPRGGRPEGPPRRREEGPLRRRDDEGPPRRRDNEPPPRRRDDEGPASRSSSGRGGAGRRRDDHRRGRDGFSGGGRR